MNIGNIFYVLKFVSHLIFLAIAYENDPPKGVLDRLILCLYDS